MELDKQILTQHRQKYQESCIPMSIEAVLKLNNLIDLDSFPYQDRVELHRESEWIEGLEVRKGGKAIRWRRQFEFNRDDEFMEKHFSDLFNTIDKELESGKYVIIIMDAGRDKNNKQFYHPEVIYEKIDEDNYNTFSYFPDTSQVVFFTPQKLRSRISKIKGTPIYTYEFIE